MKHLCKQFCINKFYPNDDVISHIIKYWEQKGFIQCMECGILVSKEKYIHEIRCRCCNNKFRTRPNPNSLKKRMK